MVISSSSVPTKVWLRKGEYVISQTALDNSEEDGVESDVEVGSENSDSEEDL